jgi:hypothetical protein
MSRVVFKARIINSSHLAMRTNGFSERMGIIAGGPNSEVYGLDAPGKKIRGCGI